MASLDGAIAFVEVQDLAVLVGEDLDFDVAGAADIAFDEDGVVAEGGGGFGVGFGEAGGEFFGGLDDAHATSSATEGCFDDDGEADFLGGGDGFGWILDGFFGARHDGDVGFFGETAGGGFVAEHLEKVGAGSDEGDVILFAGAREGGVFAEESVAWVNGVDAFFGGERADAVHVEIGLDGAFAFADEIGFVGLEAVEAEPIFLGVYGDGSDPEFVGGTKDADGDFATVES